MTTHSNLFALIDPFAALVDGRMQLLAAIDAAQVDGPELLETLGNAAARDHAMSEVARAYVDGARDFAHVISPHDRPAIDASIDVREHAEEARRALLEVIAELDGALDELLEISWSGLDTWRMHLVTLAMDDGADAQAIASRLG